MTEEMFMRLLDLVEQAGDGGFILAIIYIMQPYFMAIFWGIIVLTLTSIGTRFVWGVSSGLNAIVQLGNDYGVRRPYNIDASYVNQVLGRVRGELNVARAKSPSEK